MNEKLPGFADFRITVEPTGIGTKTWINEQELNGVTDIALSVTCLAPPRLKVSVNAQGTLSGRAQVIVEAVCAVCEGATADGATLENTKFDSEGYREYIRSPKANGKCRQCSGRGKVTFLWWESTEPVAVPDHVADPNLPQPPK